MDASLIISLASLAVSSITSVFAGYIAIIALQMTAKPKLKMNLLQDTGFSPSEQVTLRFQVENIGHWHSKPAATFMRTYVAFDPALDPIAVRFGSDLRHEKRQVLRGKGGSKYMHVPTGSVFYGEPPEVFELDITMPAKPGLYRGWAAVESKQGDCGVHRFSIGVGYITTKGRRPNS
jgi:hypothetical protein